MADIPDSSVDLILCDLPYGTTQNKWDSVLDLSSLWAQYKRICSGAVVLTAQSPFDKVLGASSLSMLKYEWLWENPRATGHLNAKKQPMKAHENILVFYSRQCVYNPQMTPGETYSIGGGASKMDNYGSFSTKRENDGAMRYPRSIQKFKTEVGLHPTQKPVALMEYLIRTYTNEGAVVLDNCMGSGTTGVACANTDRRFIGIEKDQNYFDIAKSRIEQAHQAQVA
ncbi:MAG: site-specific DNA-methyltransferase [Gammaproteobacteria bacterium]|nr:site-specific DNA-methyltransferase [Gammaproteobacteria bacterium]